MMPADERDGTTVCGSSRGSGAIERVRAQLMSRAGPPSPALWLLLSMVMGCGAQPVASPPLSSSRWPLSIPDPTHSSSELPTTEAADAGTMKRASRCLEALERQPNDRKAYACYRQAMTRMGHGELVAEHATRRRETDPDNPWHWYFEGRALLTLDVDAAGGRFGACSEAFPDFSLCIYGEALSLSAKQETASALIYLARARDSLPADAELLSTQASLLLELGRVESARGLAEQAIEADASLALAHVTASRVWMVRAALDRALEAATRATELAPDAPEPFHQRAHVRSLVADHQGARADLERALAADPRFRPAREALVQRLISIGQADPAVPHIHMLLELAPNHFEYLLLMATAMLESGHPERALAWVERALAHNEDDGEALTVKTRVLIENGAVDEALAMRAIIYADPEHAMSRRIALANALAKAKRSSWAESEFADAVAYYPEHVAPWRAYGRWHYRHRRFGRAASIFRRAIERHGKSAILHYDLADTVEELGDRAEARRLMAKASELDPSDPDYEDELARMEFVDGEAAQAAERWARLVARHPRADRAMMRLSLAYMLTQRAPEAVKVLEALVDHHPGNAVVLTRLAEALVQTGQLPRGRDMVGRAVGAGGDLSRLLPLRAAILADMGAVDPARQAFAAALELAPGNRSLRMAYAQFLGAHDQTGAAADQYRAALARNPFDGTAAQALETLLGASGQQSPAGHRYAAANPDGELRELATQVRAPGSGTTATVLRDERYVRIDRQGVESIRHVRSVLIQEDSAVARHGTATIAFHGRRPPTVARARTLTPDGGAEPVREDSIEIVDPHEGTPLFGDARRLKLRFPALEPGAIVDYEIVVHRPHPEPLGVWWDAYVLGNVDPTVRVRYALDVPDEIEYSVVTPGLAPAKQERRGDRRLLTWERVGVPPFPIRTMEARRIADPSGRADNVPAVYVSSLTTWSQVDDWFSTLFEPTAEPTPPIIDQALALAGDLESRRERIAAIYRHVEENTQYLGIEFGIGAYKPRPATSTLARGLGDCKDMTALMVALLRSLGIKAYPALIRPADQGRMVKAHPSPGQFTHVVAYVPDPGGDLWLDATSGMGTLGAVPQVLRDRVAFVVDGNGGQLIRLPVGDPNQNRLEERISFSLNPTGGGSLAIELTLTGDLAGEARQRLLPLDAEARRSFLGAPGYLLPISRSPSALQIQGLDQPTAPLVLSAELSHPDLVDVRMDGALVLHLGVGRVVRGPFDDRTALAERRSPRAYVRHIRVGAPDGYRFDSPGLTFDRDKEATRCVVAEKRGVGGSSSQSEITIELTYNVTNGGESAARQQATALDLTRSALSRPVVMVPGEAFEQSEFLSEILIDRPNQPRLWRILARVFLQEGRLDEAVEALEKAAALAPDDEETLTTLSALLLRTGRHDDAYGMLDRLRKSGGAPVEVYLALGAILVSRGESDEAAALLQEAVTERPAHPELGRRLIMALMMSGKSEAALVEAIRQSGDRPADPRLYALIGDLSVTLGDRGGAEDAYRSALGIEPDSAHVLNNLAWMLRDEIPRRAEALALARRAVTSDPQSDAAWDTLAELLFLSGDVESAVDAIRHAIELNPDRRGMYEERRAKYEAVLAESRPVDVAGEGL